MAEVILAEVALAAAGREEVAQVEAGWGAAREAGAHAGDGPGEVAKAVDMAAVSEALAVMEEDSPLGTLSL